MKNFSSPHVHLQSLDTASTVEAFVKREIELDTGTLTCTDHGSLSVIRKSYDLAKEAGLVFIPGVEAYFRDDDDPILKDAGIVKSIRYRDQDGSSVTSDKYAGLTADKKLLYTPEEGYWDHWKYAHLTMHAQDHEAYLEMVKLLSVADSRAERHGSERKPLFAWEQLEQLGSKNITFGSGCLIGVVSRNLMAYGRLDLATKYYERLRSCVKPGNFFVEVFPHICDRNWSSGVMITFEDGTTEEFPTWKSLKTNLGKVKAEDLAKEFSHKNNAHETLFEVMNNRKWTELPPRKLKSVVLNEGFIMNECSPWSPNGDLQETCNRFLLYAAKKYGDPVIISDDSHYAIPEDKIVQDIRLGQSGNWKFYGHYHRQSSEEAFAHFQKTLGTSQKEFEGWIDNNQAWAEKFRGFEFKDKISLPTKFYPEDTMRHLKSLIDHHGRMKWENPVWEARLKKEIQLLRYNGVMDWLPYFFVIEEAIRFYEEELEELTGPGRGSAAGMLLAYVLGITHADPIEFGLSEDRFMTIDRIQTGKNPDIDVDFGNRDPLINSKTGWLKKRFGNYFSQISTDTTMKVRSSVKDVARVIHGGCIPPDIEDLTKNFLNAPEGIEDRDFVFGYKNEDGNWVDGVIDLASPEESGDKALQTYITRYPTEWEIVQKCLGLARNKSRHPCSYVVANLPIQEFIPTTSVGGITVTQYTAKSVEAVGGQKMDFLGVNSLKDVGDCIKLVQDIYPKIETKSILLEGERVPRFRLVPFKGKLYDIWKLPEEQAVYHDICAGRTETVFQFNTPGAIGWLEKFNFVKSRSATEIKMGLSCAEDLAAFTALDRPGPLDYYLPAPEGWEKEHGPNMLEEFARRAAGKPRIGSVAILDQLLPETYGIIVYQEQLMKVFEKIGKTSAIEAANFREHISKKKVMLVDKDKTIFMKGAVETLGEKEAEQMWEMLKTFGNYGFNKSHAVCYASKLGYACAFLKHFYPLQWWTSVLRNAKKEEVNSKFWRFCGHLIDMPDVNLSGDMFEIQNERIRAPTDLLHGIGEKAHAELIAGAPYKDIHDFCQRIQDKKVREGEWVDAKEKKKVPEVDPEILKDNPKAKMVIEVPVKKFKLGRSSLNSSIVATLIISGAMDSLFPKDMLVLDMLQEYEKELANVQGKKNPQKIAKKYDGLNQFSRYQMKKAVLPAFSGDLLSMVLPMADKFNISLNGLKPSLRIPGHWKKNPEGDVAPFLSGEEIINLDLLAQKSGVFEQSINVAAAAYIKADCKFLYGGAARKEAIELILDINGTDIKTVKWSGKDGKLEKMWDRKWAGAIAIVQMVKFAPERFFAVNDVIIVQDILDLTTTEESKE